MGTPAIKAEEEQSKEAAADSSCSVSDFKVTENNSEVHQEVKEGSHGMMSEQVNKEMEQQEEEDLPVPPAKGYNLDFLDNLDDPNFNPFETKTAVLNNFDSSAPVSGSQNPSKSEEGAAPEETGEAPKSESKPRKPPMRKPMARKPLLRKPVKKPDPVEEKPTEAAKDEEDDLPAVPQKGYNMDFLDQLDDPNFNPFETKTAVKAQFDTSAPVEVLPEKAAEEVPEENKTEPNGDKVEEPEKPVKKPAVKKPWLKRPALKKKQPPPPDESGPVKEEEDGPVPAAKGYNLDFLDKMDDPNFNPFETKTAVIEKFDSSAPQEENGAETSLDQNPSQDKQETEQSDQKAEEDSKEKKPVAKKPWLKKPSLKKAVRNEEAPRTDVEEERVPVPGKAYNLDFL